ncbi:NAD(P)-dependent oxidoreductase [Allonocardiopsis opalescens]|uniref:3-hydroxyisobutyrate dehydrogenase-like beta-hydroxyacid dehydrogenase n=1 Tax=Allonocardiopsis opalescens TaxID=1144618 RepID=A0A2T0Q5G5_9ACTN|nr:NAD(P)-binding domain-containing protein [Allonocardiopsis opalescens]PRX99065.1 3-hydroxyisobutyrate dehydrogenase-like beta-hydroxyacid dehydrogenase [Allonocardiopsis opalescens]
MTDERTPVTVIGLGAMGRALAGAFLDSGHPTTVWNRSPGRADALAARGAAVAATAAEAVTASPLVVVCLLDDASVHQVLDPVASTLTGRTLVNLTNGTPAQARETADWAAWHAADYLDGGIMATPPLIGRPEGFILYSGSRTAFDAHERTLAALARPSYLHSDPGRAALYDLALLSGMYGMFGGVYHALALVRSERVPAKEFAPLLEAWLTAMLPALHIDAAGADSGERTDADASIAMQATGYVNLLDTSRAQGVSTEMVEAMGALLNRAVAEDTSDLVGLLAAERAPAK